MWLLLSCTSTCLQVALFSAFFWKILMRLYLNFLAGKSTILRLLFRFFDPHSGTVRNELYSTIPNSSILYIALHATYYFAFSSLLLLLFYSNFFSSERLTTQHCTLDLNPILRAIQFCLISCPLTVDLFPLPECLCFGEHHQVCQSYQSAIMLKVENRRVPCYLHPK